MGALTGALKRDRFLYLLLLPAVLVTLVFSYLPMLGIVAAFQDYDFLKGFSGSPWVGLKHFRQIVELPLLTKAIWNTLRLSLLNLAAGFPAPILLALMLNELRVRSFKRVVQSLTYLPYFLSWIAVVGFAYTMLSTYGPLNDIRALLLGEKAGRIMFLAEQRLFVANLVVLTLWKSVGWGSIIYLAALASVDVQLYEAAYIDGAGRLKQIIHVTLPSIMPTAMILLIFSLGGLMASNFELVYGMQNPYIDFEVVSTVVYKYGIQKGNYSMAAAVGFSESAVAFSLTAVANSLSKRVSGVSLW